MSVYEQLMGIGDWDLTLVPDTPREVRDLIAEFSYLVIMPERLNAEDMNDSLLPLAKFHGVVTRPGPQLDIGGHGLPFFFGNGDRYYTENTSGLDLPRRAIVGGPGGGGQTLTTWVGWVVNELDYFSLGTVTDPSSGLRKIIQTVQWVSHRELMDSICDYWDVEWKVSTTGVLDVGNYLDLWPTVTAAVTPNAAGRNIGLQGFESMIGLRDDFWEYASRVYVRSPGGVGEAGGVSPYRGPAGSALWVSAVYDGQSVPPFDAEFAADRIITTVSSTGRANSVTVSTSQFDVTGTIEPGGRVYAYDPETTLTDIAAAPVYWQGDVIQPVQLRVVSVRWPIEDGYGVLLRYFTDSGGPVWDVNYLDLTDYIEWEQPGTDIEIGRTVNPERYLR